MVLDAYKHQSYSFDRLVEDLSIKRDKSRSVLFDVMVVLQNLNRKKWQNKRGLKDLRVLPFEDFDSGITKFDLTFNFSELPNGLQLDLEYNTDIYSHISIERLADHLEQLMHAVTFEPSKPICYVDYLSTGEKKVLTDRFGGVLRDKVSYSSVLELFREQVNKNPDNLALLVGLEEVSYRLLDELSNQLADYLRLHYNIERNDRIGIKQRRGKWMIVSILAILKAGAAYVPVDPDYPTDRVNYIIENSDCKLVINETELAIFQNEQHQYNKTSFQVDVIGADLAYVIYTSGSTGTPKGCMISRNNLANYIQWANTYYFSGVDKPVFPLFTSLSFDLTITSIFCSLTNGGTLYIYDPSIELTEVLRHAVSKDSIINCMKITPSHVTVLKELEIPEGAVDVCILGGEDVTPEHIRILKHIDSDMRVYNEYGPTETTIGCIVTALEVEKPIFIGNLLLILLSI